MINSRDMRFSTFLSGCFLYLAMVVILFCLLLLEGKASAFWTEVHELVTAGATIVQQVPQEFFLYSGNPGDRSFHYKNSLAEGAYDEDADRDPRLGRGPFTWWGLLNWGTHFWDPAGGPAGGLLSEVSGLPVNIESKNAYQRASDLYTAAKDLYDQDPGAAYYLLGRVSHLLTDMAAPAHVHLDPHISDASTTGDDSLEEYTGIKFGSLGMPAFESMFSVSTISPPVPEDLPNGGYKDEPVLFNMFYSLATFSKTFDSDDADGAIGMGTTRGRSIYVQRTDLKNVYAFRSGYPEIVLTGGYDISALRHKFVLLDSLINSLTGGITPFEGIRLQFEDASEFHIFSEFQLTDIGDRELDIMSSKLVPAALGYVAALYRSFWNDTHPSLKGVIPDIIFDGAARDRTVARPNPLEFRIDISPHAWEGIYVDVYVWAELVSPDGRYRLYYTGDWTPFDKIADIRPAISHFPLSNVADLKWQVSGNTSPLPAGKAVFHLCLGKSSGSFRPSESVCGGASVSIE